MYKIEDDWDTSLYGLTFNERVDVLLGKAFDELDGLFDDIIYRMDNFKNLANTKLFENLRSEWINNISEHLFKSVMIGEGWFKLDVDDNSNVEWTALEKDDMYK